MVRIESIKTKVLQKTEKFDEPMTDQDIWPCQGCAFFKPRETDALVKKECWYCRYADFRVSEEESLNVGLCCWPKERNK